MAGEVFDMESEMSEATEIAGVYIADLRIISDERGSIMKMIVDTSETFFHSSLISRDVEEIYFSTVNPGIVKAWHGHKKMTLNYACILGSIMVGLCDLRVGSTFGKTAVVHMDALDNYKLLTIPPGVWNGFRSNSDAPAMIANAANMRYTDFDIERIHPRDFPIDFDWGPYEVAG